MQRSHQLCWPANWVGNGTEGCYVVRTGRLLGLFWILSLALAFTNLVEGCAGHAAWGEVVHSGGHSHILAIVY